jgi:hypothetical protein
MLNQLITPMNFIVIRDAIAEVIAKERDEQLVIAKADGYTQAEIANNINFGVYSALWRPLSIEDMPAVAVYSDNMNFPADLSYGSQNYNHATFNIDCYAVGQNGVDEFGEIVRTAEQNADTRLNYLVSQIYKILFSETNWKKNTANLVTASFITGVFRIQESELNNETQGVLGYRIQLRIEFNEPTQIISGVELKQIYFSLKIRDELIDPFVLIQLAEEEPEEGE